MRSWQGQWAAIGWLALAGPVPARGAGTLAAGTELIYTGTLEKKEAQTGMPNVTYRTRETLSALVARADPKQGYTVLCMRDIRPELPPGRNRLPPYAEVVIERYRPDGRRLPPPPEPPRPILGGPLVGLTWNRPIPFGSFDNLKPGESWYTNEVIPLAGVHGPWVDFNVTGETKVAGRSCVRIKTALHEPPKKNDIQGTTVTLTGYTGSLCVEPETRLVTSDQWQTGALYTAEGRQAKIDISAAVALKETRQLPPAEVAARMKQAKAVQEIVREAFSGEAGGNRKQQLAATQHAIAQFRREHPGSRYAAALAPVEMYLQPEARRLALQDAPAPAFRLASLAGAEQTLGQYRGKIILLSFFASW